jgi:protein O-mannosyl-transferase
LGVAARRRKSPVAPAVPAVPAAPAAPAAAGRVRRRVSLVLAGVLLLAGFAAYANSFDGALVLDDIRAIALNPTIRSLDTALAPPPANTVSGRPVANLSFALNYWLAPGEVRDAFLPDPASPSAGAEAITRNLFGYHAVNLAIHLAAGLLLFGVARRTFARVAGLAAEGTSAWPDTVLASPSALAFATTLLWLVHPLHTEAVTYLVQRVESLMALFYLATLYAAIRAGEERAGLGWSIASIGCCALGMATKEVMVTAPLIVVLWDLVFAGRPIGRSRLRLWGGLAATWIVFAMLVWHEHRAPSLGGADIAWRYLLSQSAVLVHYLRLSFVPSPLVFLYTWPLAASLLDVWPQVIAMPALVLLTIVGLIRRKPLAFAAAWFLVILAPTSSVLPIITEIAAEHRMYLPLAGVIAAVVGFAAWLARRTVGSAGSRARAFAAVDAVVLLAAATVLLAGLTHDRNRDYASDVALWGDTVRKEPWNPRARTAYGVALFGERRLGEAESQLVEAVRLAPDDAVARVRLGGLLASQGRLTEAIEHLEQAARITGRRDPQVLGVLAAALAQQERFLPAAAAADEARQAALAQGQPELADDLSRRAAMYRARAGY